MFGQEHYAHTNLCATMWAESGGVDYGLGVFLIFVSLIVFVILRRTVVLGGFLSVDWIEQFGNVAIKFFAEVFQTLYSGIALDVVLNDVLCL